MARKNLLKGLMDAPPAPTDAPEDSTPIATRVDVAKPRYSSGAIGAVSQSISDLKARAVQEINTDLIDGGGIRDRLDDAAGLTALTDSILEYGQQVPVLLRPHPTEVERFQIVYGRRRVAALQALGKPVKALIRHLDDRELIVAQGQENSARRDLSFIERVNFARQMRDLGYKRKTICDALHVDKTLTSRMLSVADRIPADIIESIGAAPSIGRDRWLKLADLLTEDNLGLVALMAHGDTSDDRFEAVVKALTPRAAPPAQRPPQQPLLGQGGTTLGMVKRAKGKTTLTLDSAKSQGFEDWLIENISDLHSRFQSQQD